MNNSGPTAQIIERDGWKATLDFVGHRKAITVVVAVKLVYNLMKAAFCLKGQRRVDPK